MSSLTPTSSPGKTVFLLKLGHWSFGLNIFISENNIYGNYNIVIYINLLGLEQKQYCLFGSFPNHLLTVFSLHHGSIHFNIQEHLQPR